MLLQCISWLVWYDRLTVTIIGCYYLRLSTYKMVVTMFFALQTIPQILFSNINKLAFDSALV